MKKLGHLNRDIARVLASMGHTDSIVIADCGLPIPAGVECIDLSVNLGKPSFEEILESVLADFVCEHAVFAEECKTHNQHIETIANNLAATESTSVTYTSHEDFKLQCHRAKAVIRTGDCTPYANVILHSGVIF